MCAQEPVREPAAGGVGGRAVERRAGAAVARPLRAGAPAAAAPAAPALPVSDWLNYCTATTTPHTALTGN